jgi:hypothetical protein
MTTHSLKTTRSRRPNPIRTFLSIMQRIQNHQQHARTMRSVAKLACALPMLAKTWSQLTLITGLTSIGRFNAPDCGYEPSPLHPRISESVV